jgi:molecular chaperone HscB
MDVNYFDFYGIPEQLFIDESELKSKFLAFSKQYHPDFYINDAEKYEDALEKSSFNNQAFRALNSFNSRLAYMLEYYNLVGNTSQKLPQDFLIEMMEINESIMDLKFEFDAIKQSEIIKKIKELSQNFEQHIHYLSREFDKINPILSENRRDVLIQLNDIYLKQKYVLRLQESLDKFAAP